MKGDTSFLIELGTGHFCTSQPSTDQYLDPISSHPHGRSNGHLNGSPERDLPLYLTCYIVRYNSSIQFRSFDFVDINLYFLFGDLFQFFLELIHLLSAFSNDDPWSGCIYRYRDQLQRSFNNNFGNTGLGKSFIEVFTDSVVFNQFGRIIISPVPVRVPTFDDSQTICYWICFLSHLNIFKIH